MNILFTVPAVVLGLLPSNITGTFACPTDIVMYTCADTQAVSMRWRVQGYIEFVDKIVFAVRDNVEGETKTKGNFVVTLVEVANRNGAAADITSTLTLRVEDIVNGTTIYCDSSTNSHATVYIASKWYTKHNL